MVILCLFHNRSVHSSFQPQYLVPCLAHKEELIPRVLNWPALYVFSICSQSLGPSSSCIIVFQGKNVPIGKINHGSFLQQRVFCCAKLTYTHEPLPNSDFLFGPTLHNEQIGTVEASQSPLLAGHWPGYREVDFPLFCFQEGKQIVRADDQLSVSEMQTVLFLLWKSISKQAASSDAAQGGIMIFVRYLLSLDRVLYM